MADDSADSYEEFVKAVRAKWVKLDPEVKSQLKAHFGDIEAILGNHLVQSIE
jgi:hypothetical protein